METGSGMMSEGTNLIKKMIPIIVITWILSLVTTLAIVYVAPNIFPISVSTDNMVDSAVVTAKLANGTVTSAKILDGTITAVDIESGSIITVKVADNAVTVDKIADEAVTNVKLAPQAIPFASTYKTDFNTTTETTQYVDMNGMSVSLSVNRKSHILIMFNVEAYASEDEWLSIRALVGQDVAHPGEIYLTPNIYGSGASGGLLVDWAAYGYNFCQPSVSAGTYTIKIQWKVSDGLGYIADRILTVIALPE